MEPSKTKDNKE